ncbi:hypothetical protein DOM22_11850 [Bdellovibrio sp. ZAP7]|uniref:hypothetical protein n=1 Tax=Bdellovibrio sp. ZAP7 TaxID=2231053 RepID=UPI001156DEC0|nr:hypothetical protein [Bdellovibrio sp. ZAP7]QDK45791.1 hypothetical protein DOM22_11850 [Bdellovibrio sp. ZAP7]
MNTMKSVFSLMIVSVAMVACTGNSGGGGGNPDNAVYPQPTVIGPYDQNQYPPNSGGVYPNQSALEPGTYTATVRCDNDWATDRIVGTSIAFSFNQDGSYAQEVSADYRCMRNCLMFGSGTYTVNAGTFTINQTRLVNEQGYELQGARSNTLQVEINPASPRRKKSGAIVLRDNGTENICGGPFTMSLKKQREQRRNDGRGY